MCWLVSSTSTSSCRCCLHEGMQQQSLCTATPGLAASVPQCSGLQALSNNTDLKAQLGLNLLSVTDTLSLSHISAKHGSKGSTRIRFRSLNGILPFVSPPAYLASVSCSPVGYLPLQGMPCQ